MATKLPDFGGATASTFIGDAVPPNKAFPQIEKEEEVEHVRAALVYKILERSCCGDFKDFCAAWTNKRFDPTPTHYVDIFRKLLSWYLSVECPESIHNLLALNFIDKHTLPEILRPYLKSFELPDYPNMTNQQKSDLVQKLAGQLFKKEMKPKRLCKMYCSLCESPDYLVFCEQCLKPSCLICMKKPNVRACHKDKIPVNGDQFLGSDQSGRKFWAVGHRVIVESAESASSDCRSKKVSNEYTIPDVYDIVSNNKKTNKFSIEFAQEIAKLAQKDDSIVALQEYLLLLEDKVPKGLMHPHWLNLEEYWSKAVKECNEVHEFKVVLSAYQKCIKSCVGPKDSDRSVFVQPWKNSSRKNKKWSKTNDVNNWTWESQTRRQQLIKPEKNRTNEKDSLGIMDGLLSRRLNQMKNANGAASKSDSETVESNESGIKTREVTEIERQLNRIIHKKTVDRAIQLAEKRQKNQFSTDDKIELTKMKENAKTGNQIAYTVLQKFVPELFGLVNNKSPRNDNCGLNFRISESTANEVCLQTNDTTKTPLKYPDFNRFRTKHDVPSILILPKCELKQLARFKYGKKDDKGTKHINLPHPNPLFGTCWQYRTQTATSIAELSLQARILAACIKEIPNNINGTSKCEVIERKISGQFSEIVHYKVITHKTVREEKKSPTRGIKNPKETRSQTKRNYIEQKVRTESCVNDSTLSLQEKILYHDEIFRPHRAQNIELTKKVSNTEESNTEDSKSKGSEKRKRESNGQSQPNGKISRDDISCSSVYKCNDSESITISTQSTN